MSLFPGLAPVRAGRLSVGVTLAGSLPALFPGESVLSSMVAMMPGAFSETFPAMETQARGRGGGK